MKRNNPRIRGKASNEKTGPSFCLIDPDFTVTITLRMTNKTITKLL